MKVICCATLLLTAGCATALRSDQETVAVRTSPPGAKIYVSGESVGTTPADVTFKKTGKPIEFRFELEGSVTQHYFLKSGGHWLHTIDWIFVIPGVVDQFFVNRCDYEPKIIHVELRPSLGHSTSR